MNCNKEPEYLSKGDSIGLISTARKISLKEIEYAIEILQKWSLNVVTSKNLFRQNNQFSGTDEERAHDLQDMINNKNIKAILCVRGGYGTVRVLDLIDFSMLLKNPKWIIGYSDITAIHNDLHIQKSESIHGLMCKSLEELDINKDESVKLLKKTLFGNSLSYQIVGNSYNVEGKASGQLVGGNLTLLHCLLGSKSSIDTKGKILFIEDLGEYLYHIDRMLYSLKRAGYFDNLNGLIVGDFTDLRKNTTPFGRNLKELILDIVNEYNIPVVFGFPAGHGEKNFPMIFGREIELIVSKDGADIKFYD